jgi:hypothetical protein
MLGASPSSPALPAGSAKLPLSNWQSEHSTTPHRKEKHTADGKQKFSVSTDLG